MVVVLAVMTALFALGAFATLGVRKGVAQAAHARHEAVAFYAAESGVAAAADFLRRNYDPNLRWGAFVSAGNQEPPLPAGIPGNQVRPGEAGHLLDSDQAWYEVAILNNVGDPQFDVGGDADARVVVRSTGHGPGAATVVLEVEIRPDGAAELVGRPCPGYAQRGIAEDGAGRNDCLEEIVNEVVIYRPGS